MDKLTPVYQPSEEVYGKGALCTIGKLVMQNHGKVSIDGTLYPKILIGGVVFGEFVDGKEDKLYEGGFSFLTRERRFQKTFPGYYIGQIMCEPGWDKKELWGKELPIRNCSGIGKLLVRYKGTVRMGVDRLKKYLIGGVLCGESLRDVSNQEIWSGTLMITPTDAYRGCDELRGLTIDQALTSPFWHDPKKWKEHVLTLQENKPIIDSFLDLE